jgi:aromatic-L-amino-acid/L-tryptophan decarboxylase
VVPFAPLAARVPEVAEDDNLPALDGIPAGLDPSDWNAYRATLHQLVDACVDQLAEVRAHPWQPVPAATREAVAIADAPPPDGLAAVARAMTQQILPYHSGGVHPRFFGWVQGTGNAAALMADIVASTMNSNCGGRDHGAIYVERAVIDWCRKQFGFPEGASGVLVTGTSQATVVALAAARQWALPEVRRHGMSGMPRLVLYAAEGVHHALTKAAELIGIGADAVRAVPLQPETAGMDMALLRARVQQDRSEGLVPFCVAGTAGSVDRGAFDPLADLAAFCRRERLWFHVDGAFGAWTRLAAAPWRDLSEGIQHADSLAVDFHKWMYVQYDCGLALLRDEDAHRAAFAARPAYIARQDAGLGGGDPWFCDYGTDLSRGFRALKVWATLQAYGTERLGAAITANCRLAAHMGHVVEAAPELHLVEPVRSNVCCFTTLPEGNDACARNTAIVQALQMSGEAVFSTTRIGGRTVIRAAITNHRTTREDVEAAVAAVRGALR